jgi:hypothetical protein
MVYNRDSIWRNFFVPYVMQRRRKAIRSDVPLDDAFRMSTDGPNCPIARSYSFDEVSAMAEAAGLQCKEIGVALSNYEIDIWKKYSQLARRDRGTSPDVRRFMNSLERDDDGLLIDGRGRRPGVNLVLELTHRMRN